MKKTAGWQHHNTRRLNTFIVIPFSKKLDFSVFPVELKASSNIFPYIALIFVLESCC